MLRQVPNDWQCAYSAGFVKRGVAPTVFAGAVRPALLDQQFDLHEPEHPSIHDMQACTLATGKQAT